MNGPEVTGTLVVVVLAQEDLVLVIHRQFVNALRAIVELLRNQVLKELHLVAIRVPANDLSLPIHPTAAINVTHTRIDCCLCRSSFRLSPNGLSDGCCPRSWPVLLEH